MLLEKLNRPIDNSPLIAFRIFFGVLMFFESIGAILTGWLKETFVDPKFTFNFMGLDFLQVLVGPQM
ncbi:MAG: HTTM domain-containing protein, partial [Saprospiraceae bacterium]|nr:HTTM domain-containing protein [Saprospiraceae bacterium]